MIDHLVGPTARTRVALGLVVAVAVVLRVRQYAVGRSLWHDEALLALVIRERSLAELVTEELPRTQVAPPGFLVAEKLLGLVSDSDQWLRLGPFLASLALVWLAWLYSSELSRPIAKIVFVVVATWSPVLLYYGSELKQYGVDATVTMALLVAFAKRKDHPRRLLVVGAVAVFVSHPAVIVLFAVSVALAIERVRESGLTAGVTSLRDFVVAWGAAVGGAVLQIQQTNDGGAIKFFWADSFAPLPTSGEALRWWWESALGLVHLTSTLRGIASQQRLDEWTSPVVVVSLLVLSALVLVLALSRPEILVIPVTAVLATLVLSGLDIYGFRGRLLIFLIPLVAMTVAHSIDEIAAGPGAAIMGVVGVFVVVQFGWSSASVLVDPDDRFDIVEALERLDDEYVVGEVIVLGRGTGGAFEYYVDDYGFKEATIETVEVYEVDAIRREGAGAPVWFVASHVLERDMPAIEELDRSPAITSSWSGDAVILRRLASPEAPR